jgi:uncharacterized protein
MDPGQLLQGRTRETTIVRDDQGRWYQDGQPLEHPNLTRAFDRWIERAEDGRYCLKNDINWAYVRIDGPPFFVRSVRIGPGEQVTLLLSNEKEEPLRAASLRTGPDGALYVDVGDGSMVARFDRHAASQLEGLLAEDGEGVYLKLGGAKFRPESVSDPLQPSATRGRS